MFILQGMYRSNNLFFNLFSNLFRIFTIYIIIESWGLDMECLQHK